MAIAVTVNAVPNAPIISPAGNIGTCIGTPVVLSVPAGGNYIWSNGLQGNTISVSISASYTVRQILNGCTSVISAPTVVTINAVPTRPTITTLGSSTICAGSSVYLKATAGGSSYIWTDGTTSSTTINDSLLVIAGGTFTVRAVSNGCTSAVSIGVTIILKAVPTVPTILIGGPITFCTGGTVVLSAPTGTGNNYIWSNGATTTSITVNGSGTYTLRAINGTCTSATSAPVVVTVSPATPPVTVTASGPTTFCQGGQVVLKAPTSTSYLWSNGATSDSINVTAAGNYSVQVTNGGFCLSAPSNVVSIVVNAATAPSITALGNTTLCQGDSVTLLVAIGGIYIWSNGARTRSIVVKAANTYTVQTIVGACTSATSLPITVSVNLRPSIPTIMRSLDTLSVTPQPNTTIQWYLTGQPILGAINAILTMTQIGVYTVVLTNTQGCTATAADLNVLTNLANAISSMVSIYPNPTERDLTIIGLEIGQVIKLDILDINGRIYQSETIAATSANHLLSVKELAQGSWILRITLADGATKHRRFVKQ